MRHVLQQLMSNTLDLCQQQGLLPSHKSIALPAPIIERTREKKFGDFSCNIALQLAKPLGKNPRDLAALLVEQLPSSPYVQSARVAGPGFINFFLTPEAQEAVVGVILKEKNGYGTSTRGAGTPVLLEFVSANPTGPLHVGHGRGAAYGSVLANLLECVGYKVSREYYVNDAGRQADILAVSVWLRYLESFGETFIFPEAAYKGDYIHDIAASLRQAHGEALRKPCHELFTSALSIDSPNEPVSHDKYIDTLIDQARRLLGTSAYLTVQQHSVHAILEDIRNDLTEFGVTFDTWYSERQLFEKEAIPHCLEQLKANHYLYEREGTLWFNSTAFDDDKDRVVQRRNGQTTYFASDIAYHADKLNRGAKKLINILGADHHGYVARLKAGIAAMGNDPHCLDVLLVQFAILYRGKERVSMSTRSGSFITLRELREEVGNDAARFFYVMRKCEQHLDFDLELAKSQSNENPVYYIQYAHARICSVQKQLQEKGFTWDENNGLEHLNQLTQPQERTLMDTLSRYPEVIEAAAESYEPHVLTTYLRECANHFHTYYNAHAFIVEEETLRNGRLCLINATRWVLYNGLSLLGISAPESM